MRWDFRLLCGPVQRRSPISPGSPPYPVPDRVWGCFIGSWLSVAVPDLHSFPLAGFLILAWGGLPALWVLDPGAGVLPSVVCRPLRRTVPDRVDSLSLVVPDHPAGWGSVGLLAYIRNGIGSA
jgi:hypothetical protein